jgi:hypothetical protein
MIKYRLSCSDGHEFESWFRSIADFDTQSHAGDVACPLCASTEITKQPMAPAVVSNRSITPRSAPMTTDSRVNPEMLGMLRAFKKAVVENSEDVGTGFADEARKIHFGEAEERNIRGSSTMDEARALAEEGVPFGIVPPLPEDLN